MSVVRLSQVLESCSGSSRARIDTGQQNDCGGQSYEEDRGTHGGVEGDLRFRAEESKRASQRGKGTVVRDRPTDAQLSSIGLEP